MTGDKPRVVITGVGLVTALGGDRESTWKALLAGQGAVRHLTPSELADRAGLPERVLNNCQFLGAPALGLSRAGDENVFLQEPNIQLAMRAAKEAVKEARIDWDALEPYRLGSVIGTSKGGMQSFARLAFAESSRSGKELPQEAWPMVWPGTPASLVAETWNIKGPVLCPVAACARSSG